MRPIPLTLVAASLATGAVAQDSREIDAHVHGVSTAEIAIEDGTVHVGILAPGMDIVGFEYESSSAEDRDAVEAAIRQMLMPENVVTLPAAAGCHLTKVLAELHSGDRDHDDAEDHMAEDHEQEEHAGDNHDGNHADEAQHSAFHLTYAFDCEDQGALTTIGFPFFDTFENAQEIAAQFGTESGAGRAEIGRAAPELKLE
ncbi:DUF2796 domain-containing protein [Thalassococcus profundi]|uniref:DUF2796 domain-containing protein n=1 Tax=Thalassococcus profundi TaxID=2282382 RepID=A0A369TS43_9RHOB|nr:DUF2796 domain-containing protein [Thalassococcus profundi]RDD68109.1 DUF2796 domain-containing protein [Thalassococcus profundi]